MITIVPHIIYTYLRRTIKMNQRAFNNIYDNFTKILNDIDRLDIDDKKDIIQGIIQELEWQYQRAYNEGCID